MRLRSPQHAARQRRGKETRYRSRRCNRHLGLSLVGRAFASHIHDFYGGGRHISVCRALYSTRPRTALDASRSYEYETLKRIPWAESWVDEWRGGHVEWKAGEGLQGIYFMRVVQCVNGAKRWSREHKDNCSSQAMRKIPLDDDVFLVVSSLLWETVHFPV